MDEASWLKHRELEAQEERLWELFHENSKFRRFDHGPEPRQRFLPLLQRSFRADGAQEIARGSNGKFFPAASVAVLQRRRFIFGQIRKRLKLSAG
jgi:hypothetical protein